MMLGMFVHLDSGGYLWEFLKGMTKEYNCQDSRLHECLNFQDGTKVFSKPVKPASTPTSSVIVSFALYFFKF